MDKYTIGLYPYFLKRLSMSNGHIHYRAVYAFLEKTIDKSNGDIHFRAASVFLEKTIDGIRGAIFRSELEMTPTFLQHIVK
ncbi:hypothetical protein CHS0354_030201 [Potamilus streckersoni]|uniref:Uncharacterized protein n=1 Tax=Potamilus streckersoni TaxID=2493646 RepID=A0AAE0RSX8_9BIVA|nr:hypothetical protein CHS0354_030201 [Potamilus streckersoni]